MLRRHLEIFLEQVFSPQFHLLVCHMVSVLEMHFILLEASEMHMGFLTFLNAPKRWVHS
jgi:hypothetical protein